MVYRCLIIIFKQFILFIDMENEGFIENLIIICLFAI